MQSQGGDDGELEGGKEREMQRYGCQGPDLGSGAIRIDQPLGGKEGEIPNLTPGFLA